MIWPYLKLHSQCNFTFAADFDYSLPQTMVLPFNVTTSVTCLEIEVTDDLVLENLEQLTLQLSTSTTFIMLSPDTATINIADNDSELSGHSHECTL